MRLFLATSSPGDFTSSNSLGWRLCVAQFKTQVVSIESSTGCFKPNTCPLLPKRASSWAAYGVKAAFAWHGLPLQVAHKKTDAVKNTDVLRYIGLLSNEPSGFRLLGCSACSLSCHPVGCRRMQLSLSSRPLHRIAVA